MSIASQRPNLGYKVVSAFIFSIFVNLLMLTGPLFMLQVYDRVLASRSEETLVVLFTLVAGLFALHALLEFARSRVMARVGSAVQSTLAPEVYRSSVERAALRRTGIPGTIQDLDAVRSFLSSPVLLAFFDLPWTPVFIAAIFIFHPMLGWLAVAGGVLLVIVAVINQLLTYATTNEAAVLNSAAQVFVRRSEDRGELIWAQGMLAATTARFTKAQNDALVQTTSTSDWTGSFSSFTKSFRLFLQSAMLALGAWLVLQQELTPGAMIAASILLGRALAPIDVSVSQWPAFQRARGGWRDVKALLKAMPECENPTPLPVPTPNVSVSEVTLALRITEAPVLSRVSFNLAAGDAIGVIGRSGSGKSTLAKVITGLIPPTAGEVRLGGATVAQYGPETLGQYIGYLPQDIHLFEATIAENIAQLATEPDPAKIVAAAQKARVHEVILSLPKGYDTRMGPGDTQLSGGQKQRLALARALYNDPLLLILDEPNSALDAEGSEALNAAVTEMKRAGRSVMIMTHRPTAIAACDKLLLLEAGKVAALGERDQIILSMMANSDQVQRATRRSAK